MPIKLQCPAADCQQALNVKDDLAGKRIKCPRCGTHMDVPAPVTAAAPETVALLPPPEVPQAETPPLDHPDRSKRKRRRKASPDRGGGGVIIFGVPLWGCLTVLVVGLGVVGGGVYGLSVLKGRGMLGGGSLAKPEVDWHKDYDAFLAHLKAKEQERIDAGGTTSPDLGFPIKSGFQVQRKTNGVIDVDVVATADEAVEWEAVFQGVTDKGELKFDLETEYTSTVNYPSDKSGGTKFRIFFNGDLEKGGWNKVQPGDKVRFTGKLGKVFITTGGSNYPALNSVTLTVTDVQVSPPPQ